MGIPKRDDREQPIRQENGRRIKAHESTNVTSFWVKYYQERRVILLTSRLDLYNDLEALHGRLIRPIMPHGLPFTQLFDAFNIFMSETAKRVPIVTFESNVDLLGVGVNPWHATSNHDSSAHLPQN